MPMTRDIVIIMAGKLTFNKRPKANMLPAPSQSPHEAQISLDKEIRAPNTPLTPQTKSTNMGPPTAPLGSPIKYDYTQIA